MMAPEPRTDTQSTLICAECHGVVRPANAYHSWLYCELVKLGHHDPEAYLRSYGFRRDETLPDGGF